MQNANDRKDMAGGSVISAEGLLHPMRSVADVIAVRESSLLGR
jgi:hypothetical protein